MCQTVIWISIAWNVFFTKWSWIRIWTRMRLSIAITYQDDNWKQRISSIHIKCTVVLPPGVASSIPTAQLSSLAQLLFLLLLPLLLSFELSSLTDAYQKDGNQQNTTQEEKVSEYGTAIPTMLWKHFITH